MFAIKIITMRRFPTDDEVKEASYTQTQSLQIASACVGSIFNG